ncbi:MAG: hypothetical protein GY696_28950 [Gammaproteobacteria bacterium]|nr:hypothetical protein [Gammaproteobacteria bacterium]
MISYLVASFIGLTILYLFFVRKPVNAIMLFLFARPAAQPLLSSDFVIGIPATGLLGGLFLLSSILYVLSSARLKKSNNIAYKFLFAFLLFAFASTVFSENTVVSLDAFARLLVWPMLGYLVSTVVKNISDCKKILVSVLLGTLPVIIYGLYQVLTNQVVHKEGGVFVTSFFATANAYGIYISLSIFCAIILLELSANYKIKMYLYALIFIYVISLIFSMHRASWLLMAVLMFLLYKDKITSFRTYAIIITMVIILFYNFEIISERILELFEPRRYGVNSLSARINTWSIMIDEMLSSPFRVLVVGFGTGVATHIRLILGIVPHNDYLRILYEIGIFGLLSYVLFLITSIRQVFIIVRASLKNDRRIHIAVLFSLIYFSVISFTQNNIYDVRNMSIIIVIISISVILYRIQIIENQTLPAMESEAKAGKPR